MSDRKETFEATEAHLKATYGYPDEWLHRKSATGLSSCGGLQAFDQPDLKKLSEDQLKDPALFKRLVLSLRDLAHAGSAITFIEEEIGDDKRYNLADRRKLMCFETALIVSYCRPFSKSPDGVPALSYGTLGIKLSHFTRVLHEELMSKRNTIFAHSDPYKVEFANPVVMNWVRPDGSPFTTLSPPRFDEGILLELPRIRQAAVLVSSLRFAVYTRLQAMHGHFLEVLPSLDAEDRL
jgi:hypothetical protein